ncbi:hypothetical protein [Pseudoalteromonas denitrificans]|uniref:BNR repeat-containing family member n=1 Tax=Pseudoalteromonas denitrificans DSM 6059 TaxID=1123010 RepID=A0A1I1NN38_9GAMM|nr:hypothetical protein [Pseudoalteromonas denitrificans]SFC98846.1 hypothetical protein SAMN02745724_03128 [Pseudoalteromonas denitrificans DSM 6059]
MLFSNLLSNKLSQKFISVCNYMFQLRFFLNRLNESFVCWSKLKLKSLVSLVLLGAPVFIQAAIPIGPEFQVNSSISMHQKEGVVSSLKNGGYIIVWVGMPHGGNDHDIFAQRYKADGTKEGLEFLVNSDTADEQWSPSVTSLSNGGFIITWSKYRRSTDESDVFAQRYKSDGTADGNEFQVNTSTEGYQGSASVISLNNGDLIITWYSHTENNDSLFAQRYKADGLAYGTEFQISSATGGSQGIPTAIGLNNGGFALAWSENNSIYTQRYQTDGSLDGSVFKVASANAQWLPRAPVISSLNNGGVVIAWLMDKEDWSESKVFAQSFKANGSVNGDAFLVNTRSLSSPMACVISTLNNGNFVISWSSYFEVSDTFGVSAKSYNENGSIIDEEFNVNSTVGLHMFPAISTLDNGEFMVIWQTLDALSSISVRRFVPAQASVTVSLP